MNTWLIGNHPIGHHAFTFPTPTLTTLAANPLVPTSFATRHGEEGLQRQELGEKVFFMKARIMAGQADLSRNALGDTEFAWLSKEEVEGVVGRGYWRSVRNMLTER